MKGQSRSASAPLMIGTYFESDVLASYQYSKTYRPRDHFRPEQRLMFAVLTDAIECFQKYVGAKNRRSIRLFSEAEAWILNRENNWLFSFESICEDLQINPSCLRQGLLRWRDEHNAPKSPHKRIREPLRYQYRLRNTAIAI